MISQERTVSITYPSRSIHAGPARAPVRARLSARVRTFRGSFGSVFQREQDPLHELQRLWPVCRIRSHCWAQCEGRVSGHYHPSTDMISSIYHVYCGILHVHELNGPSQQVRMCL